jgi:hypothetical protein
MNSWWRLAGVRDALVIVGAGISVFAAIVWLNRFKQTQDVSRQFDADMIVALAGLATALCFMVALYIFRRVQDLSVCPGTY